MKKIILTSDILRFGQDLSRKSFVKNTEFISRLISKQIYYATRIETEILESGEFDNSFDYDYIYDQFGLEPSANSWAKIYNFDEEIPDKVLEYFDDKFGNNIVIGFELSPLLVNLFSMIKVPCISITWSPVRFMDDIFFSFLTNNEEVFNKISEFSISKSLVYSQAEMIKARFFRVGKELDLHKNLLLGQTTLDRSVIKDGSFVSLDSFETELLDIFSNEIIDFKPHPFAQNPKMFDSNLNINRVPDEYNIYEIFYNDKLKKVTSISSGALYEAEFFGKEPIRLIEEIQPFIFEEQPYSKNKYISVMHDFLNTNFWAEILAPLFRTYKNKNSDLAFVPNRLRKISCITWGYEEPELTQIIEKY